MRLTTPPPEQTEEIHVIRQAEILKAWYSAYDICIQHQEVAGGVAIRSLPQLQGKLTRVVGLELQGPFMPQDLRELEAIYAGIHLQPEVHSCEYADSSVTQVLAVAGYFSRGSLSVYCMDLEDSDEQPMAESSKETTTVRVGEVTSDADRKRFIAASIAGFADGGRSEELLSALARIATLRADTRLYIATNNAGEDHWDCSVGGYLYLDSTVPEYRAMGIHAALIHARLRVARDMGFWLVTLSTRQGSGSAKNAEKVGVEMAYRKEVYIKT
ncbi:uncharacterized protein BP01DRAFT_414015 [Aspergillus saccharolyticus JOP 1030-1]|uniref:N-acetyltransferase domain-containing protein n=1 Tax=Aspergillus saccharolyticus JOP 1030-1 TaxID=1450539 RepID=A0A319A6Q5_9EURO|nr:hypothetical protein BP01DRAFT_414015 [Aspergillus saccharolyticus JOP 1030-1]PYH47678.1 hypothetical protein BP01DRAFT_414015 [Aspergillus saccharolyticus JOP 1030-1]